MIDIKATFEKLSNERNTFDRIENPPTARPDLCAFLLLDRLVPGSGDIVTSAEHDEIFLTTDCDELAKAATEADILTLVRCGVHYSHEYDCLRLNV
jgi:hypothetical protein